MNMPSERELIDVAVADVRRAPAPTRGEARHVVVLEEAGGARRLPIWMGDREATQIAVLHEGLELPRPMTVQFMAELLRSADVKVVEVVINRLAWGTFYATVVISGSVGRRHVDGRPSDAIALALAVEAPIRVDTDVMTASRDRAETVHADAYQDGIDQIVREIVAGAPLPAPLEQHRKNDG